jgi:IclR family transcriptional regulator, KDG regulon repressor
MVKSAIRVMNILEIVCCHKSGLTQKEIADNLNIPKSSLSTILKDMTAREYLIHDPKTKCYLLGAQVLHLAGIYLNNIDLVDLGRPIISELSQETGETGVLAIPIGQEAIIVYKEDSLQPILPSVQVGTRLPLFSTAVGKAILAHYSDEELKTYFNEIKLIPSTKFTTTTRRLIMKEINKIRMGFPAYNNQGFREGVTAVAAPVFNHDGKVVAAISLSVLTAKLTHINRKLYENVIGRITNKFSKLLGFRNNNNEN